MTLLIRLFFIIQPEGVIPAGSSLFMEAFKYMVSANLPDCLSAGLLFRRTAFPPDRFSTRLLFRQTAKPHQNRYCLSYIGVVK